MSKTLVHKLYSVCDHLTPAGNHEQFAFGTTVIYQQTAQHIQQDSCAVQSCKTIEWDLHDELLSETKGHHQMRMGNLKSLTMTILIILNKTKLAF